MARRSFDPWAKKSKAGMRSLGKMVDFAVKVGKASAKASRSSSGTRTRRSYSSSGYSSYSSSGYYGMGIREQRRLEKERERVKGEERLRELQEQSDAIVQTMRLMEPIIPAESLKNELDNLQLPEPYQKQPFTEEKPSMDKVVADLQAEAKENISSILFWKNKQMRADYVQKNKDTRYSQLVDELEQKRKEWEEHEKITEASTNKERMQEYEDHMFNLSMYFSNNKEAICEGLEDVIGSFELPYDVEATFDYDEESHSALLELGFPGKEIIPNEKGRVLANGKLSVKQKTIKELNNDYMVSILGVGYAMASAIFNSSAVIEQIIIHGLATVVDKSSMTQEECCLYAVAFDREEFVKSVRPEDPPLDLLLLFPHNVKVMANGEMRAVDPSVMM